MTKPTSPPLKGTEEVPLPPFKLPPFLEEVFVNTPAPLEVYLGRIRDLSRNADLAPRLLAHAYVRYLGDLSGGQVIGARLRKAYGLNGLDGRRFYYFDLLNDKSAAETGEETVGERKKKLNEVKAWYRRGMDEGAGEAEKLKGGFLTAWRGRMLTRRSCRGPRGQRRLCPQHSPLLPHPAPVR